MESLLSVFGIDWKMLVLETINFLLLLAGLSYFLYTPVLKMLNDRREKVAKGVKDAEVAERRVKEVEEKRQDILAKAEREAEGIVERGVAEGKKERADIVKAAQERTDKALAEARVQAEELQRRALAESQKEVARIAILAAEKILEKS